jgi:hypothetical protein
MKKIISFSAVFLTAAGLFAQQNITNYPSEPALLPGQTVLVIDAAHHQLYQVAQSNLNAATASTTINGVTNNQPAVTLGGLALSNGLVALPIPASPFLDLSGQGYNSNAWFSADGSDSYDESTSYGFEADGSEYGVAMGQYANGFENGVAAGVGAWGFISGVGIGAGANGTNFGCAVGCNVVGNGPGNVAIGSNPQTQTIIPTGWLNTTELGPGTATKPGGLNFLGKPIADSNGVVTIIAKATNTLTTVYGHVTNGVVTWTINQ